MHNSLLEKCRMDDTHLPRGFTGADLPASPHRRSALEVAWPLINNLKTTKRMICGRIISVHSLLKAINALNTQRFQGIELAEKVGFELCQSPTTLCSFKNTVQYNAASCDIIRKYVISIPLSCQFCMDSLAPVWYHWPWKGRSPHCPFHPADGGLKGFRRRGFPKYLITQKETWP